MVFWVEKINDRSKHIDGSMRGGGGKGGQKGTQGQPIKKSKRQKKKTSRWAMSGAFQDYKGEGREPSCSGEKTKTFRRKKNR